MAEVKWIKLACSLGSDAKMREIRRQKNGDSMALLWVLLFSYAGYLFGDLPVVQENLKLLIVGIILVSILPGVIEVWRHRRQAKQQKQP